MFREVFNWFFNVDKGMGENKYARLLGALILIGMLVFAIYHKEVVAWIHLIKS